MNPIRWMAKNHVAANLLMALLIVGGVFAARSIPVEIFPDTELDMVNISVAYPGAGPEEVEQGICRPVEEAIHGIEGLKKLTCSANEGVGSAVAEILSGEDINVVVQDIKAAVDRIITFPQEAERPVVKKLVRRRSVMSVVVYGEMDTWALRQQAERLRDKILARPEVTQADLVGIPPYEISIEIDEETLRRYGLTLSSVAATVRAASLDRPGGSVKTRGGEILLRTKERRYHAKEYESIVVVSRPDGTLVRLGQIATIRDTFQETDQQAFFSGKPAAMLEIYRVGDQTPLEIARVIKALIKTEQEELPPAVQLGIWHDRSEVLKDRFDLLFKNALMGLVLVIVILGVFLQVRLAFWVTLGIPLSMLGALMFLPVLGGTINMLSLFAFILVLGIIVDDAIIVGENAFTHRRMGKPMFTAAIDGTVEVARPVIFSILTTVAAFTPLLFVAGIMGKFMRHMPIIVISVLLVSLVESLFVLPAHLSRTHAPQRDEIKSRFGRIQLRFEAAVQRFIAGPYKRLLQLAIRFRYVTLATAVTMLMLTVGLFAGGHLKMIFMPEIEGDVVRASLTMPFGTPPQVTAAHLERLHSRADELVQSYNKSMPKDQSILRGSFTYLGGHLGRGSSGASGGHLGEVAMELQTRDNRNVDSEVFAARWREAIGEIVGAESLDFKSALMHMGNAIDIQVAHDDFEVLVAASEKIKVALSDFAGVSDITDSYQEGKRELKLSLKPEARALGITPEILANQVRSAFYGAEALRLQRERNELRVMVRYPLDGRRSLADVNAMRIRTPSGGEIPFAQAAEVVDGRGFSFINRRDRTRVVNIYAKANLKKANPAEIITQLRSDLLPQLQADYPGLTFDLEGQEKERRDSMVSLKNGYIVALVLIFALLAIPFKSYSQPLLVMTAIPFGIIGAVLGHLIMGFNMSLLSGMGVVALAGVVVNDSLILIDFINRYRLGGASLDEAILEGGQRRFRPIVLTTLTTFFALVPMLTETSVQANFLIPMAISLAFGVLFATLITLLLIPAFYRILEDIRMALGFEASAAPEAVSPDPEPNSASSAAR